MIINRKLLLLLMLAWIGSLTTAFLLSASQATTRTSPAYSSGGFMLSESSLGNLVSLEEANQRAQFAFKDPQTLPPGTTLERVYLHATEKSVRLFYNNSKLPVFSANVPIKASIVISAGVFDRDPVPGMLDLPPTRVIDRGEGGERIIEIPQKPPGKIVKVCGVNGLGSDPSEIEPGRLLWWRDGVQYNLRAGLSLNELTRIANSMC